MQLGWDDHFTEIVIPAWQAYLVAESELTKACDLKDAQAIAKAGFRALREGGAATFFLSHYADIIAHERPHQLPDGVGDLPSVRKWVASNCRMLRGERPVDDVALLADVCDALKHSELLYRLETRKVSAKEAVLVLQTGFGKLNYGEGKFGGADQVVILANTGTRALSSVLQNVIDAWRTSMAWPIPEMGEA